MNEAKLVELVAVRTRMLADDILELANIPVEEAMNDNEREVIILLQQMRKLVYNHNDSNLLILQHKLLCSVFYMLIEFCVYQKILQLKKKEKL